MSDEKTFEDALRVQAVGAGTPAGECFAVLRPESIELVAPGAGIAGRVVRSWFRGGDRLLRIELADGTLVEASDSAWHAAGERVSVAVRGEVAVVR